MLSKNKLLRVLPRSGLGSTLYFFESLASTNLTALELAAEGAPHGTIVVAEQQTAGRGRAGRNWTTNPGTALAFSIILTDELLALRHRSMLPLIGALAVVRVLRGMGIEAKIKWPNDVIFLEQKLAGLLSEAHWNGNVLAHLVLGIGLNVYKGSTPEGSDFPATTLESTGIPLAPRQDILASIVSELGTLIMDDAREEWSIIVQKELAYLGREVVVAADDERHAGVLIGVREDGALELRPEAGPAQIVRAGDLSLRLVDR